MFILSDSDYRKKDIDIVQKAENANAVSKMNKNGRAETHDLSSILCISFKVMLPVSDGISL